jgi:hypothetical protein
LFIILKKIQMKIVNPDGVSAFTVTITNATTVAATYRLFDAAQLVSAVAGGTRNSTYTPTVDKTALNNTIYSNPLVLSGFNYQVSSDNSQFAQSFDIIRCSIDGRQVTHPNIIAKARRNTQFDAKLLTIQERVVVDAQTAFDISVQASETVTLTFFVEGFLKG